VPERFVHDGGVLDAVRLGAVIWSPEGAQFVGVEERHLVFGRRLSRKLTIVAES
jgi:hypothetical protein